MFINREYLAKYFLMMMYRAAVKRMWETFVSERGTLWDPIGEKSKMGYIFLSAFLKTVCVCVYR